jgi:hypothetical protein
MPAITDRARRHTADAVLRRIDDDTVSQLAEVARRPESAPVRLHALDREWDIDRVVETEAATMGLIGLALGTAVNARLLALPGAVAAAVFLYATRGLYPLLPVFRRLGVRTAREIERERYAVKALRGDFSAMPLTTAPAQSESADVAASQRTAAPTSVH